MIEVTTVPVITALILGVGILVSAVEDVSIPRKYFQTSLLDWRFTLAFQPLLRPPRDAGVYRVVFGYAAYRLTAVLRAVS